MDKMRLYDDFYANFVINDGGFKRLPQLVLICEDDKHIVEAFKVIVKNELEPSKIKIYFSTDLKQMEESLSTSFVDFVLNEETGKYKMKNDNIKLLE